MLRFLFLGIEAGGEGIIPALESAHAIAAVIERAPKMPKE